MPYLTKQDFIWSQIETQPRECTIKALEFIQAAKDAGTRIGNDGFPDTRYSSTYPAKFERIRLFIAKCRETYERMHPAEAAKLINWRKQQRRVKNG